MKGLLVLLLIGSVLLSGCLGEENDLEIFSCVQYQDSPNTKATICADKVICDFEHCTVYNEPFPSFWNIIDKEKVIDTWNTEEGKI